ncbi:MAG: hypothetical protein GXP45_04365 [bacterium]|nr:hypothetical protein [bacterium]
MYIDEHLTEDTDFLIAVSQVFTEILANIKYYPYPSIIYKISFNNYFKKTLSPIQTTSKTQINSTSKEEKKSKTTKKEQEETENKAHEAKTNSKPEGNLSNNPDELLQKLIDSLAKTSLKKALKDHIIIDKVEKKQVYLIAISKMTKMLLQKAEIQKEIEDALSQILGETYHIQVEYEDKESYFARQLG